MSTQKQVPDPNDTGLASINEPPGSDVTPPVEAKEPAPKPAEREPLPPQDELEKMTRAELDELAEARGVDISSASNKGDVIELLRKDARRRK